jgi:hypothetical protein
VMDKAPRFSIRNSIFAFLIAHDTHPELS